MNDLSTPAATSRSVKSVWALIRPTSLYDGKFWPVSMKSNDTLPARASWMERALSTSWVPSKNSTVTPGNSFWKASTNFCATLDSCWSHHETVPSFLAASYSVAICGASLGTATPGLAAGGAVGAAAAAGAVVGLGAAVGAAAGALVAAAAGAV